MIPKRSLLAALGLASASLASVPFTAIDTSWSSRGFVYSPTVTADVLFRADSDYVHYGTDSARARGSHDWIGVQRVNGSDDTLRLAVNHETKNNSDLFGDGGGVSAFKVVRDASTGRWKRIDSIIAIDFKSTGLLTWNNCGGFSTPWGTMVTSEENAPSSNSSVYKSGIRDTSDVTVTWRGTTYTLKRWQTLGWNVEFNPATGVVSNGGNKLWGMGRYSHENGTMLPDSQTVIVTDDATPSVLFKFVATTKGDFSDGQLYAWRQSDDGATGTWLAMPMALDSLIDAEKIALQHGATINIRHEWTIYNADDGYVYITETGNEKAATYKALRNYPNANLALHLQSLKGYTYDTLGTITDSVTVDAHGRILKLDVATGKLTVFVEGGAATSGTNHLSMPDGLAIHKILGRSYLFVNEDQGATWTNVLKADSSNQWQGATEYRGGVADVDINEIYVLDMDITSPTVDDLVRFGIGPRGSETTGGVISPDGTTYFVDLQHPSYDLSDAPWNEDATVALTNFDTSLVVSIADHAARRSGLEFTRSGWRVLEFASAQDVEVRDLAGRRVAAFHGALRVDLSALPSGTYLVRTAQAAASVMLP